MNAKPEQLRAEHMKGMTYKAIAEKYFIDQRTAKRYVELNLPLSELYSRTYVSILDPYKSYIDIWVTKGNRQFRQLYEDLKARGYTGSYHLMYRYARKAIDALPAARDIPGEEIAENIPQKTSVRTKPIASRIEEEKKYAASHS